LLLLAHNMMLPDITGSVLLLNTALKPWKLQVHFALKSESMLNMLQGWLKDAGKDRARMQEHVKQVRQLAACCLAAAKASA
jgi:hypothetical protein